MELRRCFKTIFSKIYLPSVLPHNFLKLYFIFIQHIQTLFKKIIEIELFKFWLLAQN